jgi:hypothetical protein
MASSKNYKFYMLLFAFYYGFGYLMTEFLCYTRCVAHLHRVPLPDKMDG